MNRYFAATLFFCCVVVAISPRVCAQSKESSFAIQVVDAETKRGVPMVQLETVNKVKYFTDSAGWIAFSEPGLFNKRVYFSVESHGYEFPEDGFGFRGIAFDVKAGGSAKLEIKRINLAERLYRITGQGIYRDSVMLGKESPIEKPFLNGDVFGQDTVQSVVHPEQIYWFWETRIDPFIHLGNSRHRARLQNCLRAAGSIPTEESI